MASTEQATQEAQGSRKWRAVLLLAVLYGIAICLKFALLVVRAPVEAVASFDSTLNWAMGGMSAAVGTFNLAVGLEDYAKNRGPVVMPQQADKIVNAASTEVVK